MNRTFPDRRLWREVREIRHGLTTYRFVMLADAHPLRGMALTGAFHLHPKPPQGPRHLERLGLITRLPLNTGGLIRVSPLGVMS